MKKHKYIIYALIILGITLFYLYVPYYDWLPREKVTIKPPGEGSSPADDIIRDQLLTNKVFKWLGKFGLLIFFTVQTFYYFAIALTIHYIFKNKWTRLFVNFGKIYGVLVSILFCALVLPTIPVAELPYTAIIETSVHILIPILYLIFTKDIGFVYDDKNKYLFLIFPITYYLMNLLVHIISGGNIWSYPFLNFYNPLSLSLLWWFRIVFNIFIFTILVGAFYLFWIKYEKKKSQTNIWD